MSTPAGERQVALPLYRTERVIASLTTAWVVILTTYMIFQNHELSQTSIYFLKIVLSMSGGVMLATLPGFFDVNYSLGGFSVRAAGGAAAFVFIYTQSPNVPAFKLDQVARPPAGAEQYRHPTADHTSAITDRLPTLVVLSFAPTSILPAPARPGYQPDYRPASDDRQTMAASVDAGVDAGSAGNGSGISIGEAVTADAGAVYAATVSYLRSGLVKLSSLLDAAAEALRNAVSKLATAARALFGLAPSSTEPAQIVGVVTEDVSARLDPLTESLFGTGTAPITAVLGGLSDLTSGLTSGLTNTVSSIVLVTDRTVQALTTGLLDTTHQLLGGTGALVGDVTGVLNNATGGLTSGLTAPVDKLVQGVTATTDKLVDTVVPKATDTVSHVLTGVNAGLNKVTEHVNAVSPGIISRIDPDFTAANGIQDLAGANDLSATGPLLGNLDGAFGKAAGASGSFAPGFSDLQNTNALLGKSFSDPLGGEALSAAPSRLLGSGQSLLPALGSGISDATSSLGLARSPLLGGDAASSSGSASPAAGASLTSTVSGIAGPTSSGSGTSLAGGGAVSSTLGTTSSIVGGALKGLGRH